MQRADRSIKQLVTFNSCTLVEERRHTSQAIIATGPEVMNETAPFDEVDERKESVPLQPALVQVCTVQNATERKKEFERLVPRYT
jgi:hypothetical protein